MNILSKKQLLQNLNSQISAKYPNKKLVFGHGLLTSKVMFIGEAPGKEEEKTGLPFIGKAGKYLDKLLLMAGLKRKSVYITNVVKFRPPNNRKPAKTEIAFFRPLLEQEISILNPKLIITLGNTAYETLFNKGKLTENHGRIQKFKNIFVFPTFHPAATFRNPKIKSLLLVDFKKLKKILKNL